MNAYMFCLCRGGLGGGNELEPVDEVEESKEPEAGEDEDDDAEKHKALRDSGKTASGQSASTTSSESNCFASIKFGK